MKKIFGIILIFNIFLLTTYGQIKYPDPKGHVNDFANILDLASEQMLESKLSDYGKKTSIEIAVATINSLEGISIEEYALNLFQKWGVGDKDKNNGILLLVAPNEREMRIEVGYGMEPDLTDGRAGMIIREKMIPYFRDGKMSEGVISGVDSILEGLGSTPFEARLEERRIVEQKRLAEEKIQEENAKAFMFFAGIALVIFLVIGTPIVLVTINIRRRKKLQAQFKTNSKIIEDCWVLIRKAEKDRPSIAGSLAELKEICPKEVWNPLAEVVLSLPARVESAKKEADNIIKLHDKNGWLKSEETSAVITIFLATVTDLAGLSKRIETTITDVQQAKSQSPELLNNTLGAISKVRGSKILEHKDVSEKSRKYLKEAELKCGEAQKLMDSSRLINWLVVIALLNAAAQLVLKSKSKAKSDKEEAEKERRPKPVYKPYGSSPSHHSSGSGGSSFGGFGGGRSGGGGASGKW